MMNNDLIGRKARAEVMKLMRVILMVGLIIGSIQACKMYRRRN